jgi:membrane-bound lytic murein transglycosylase B
MSMKFFMFPHYTLRITLLSLALTVTGCALAHDLTSKSSKAKARNVTYGAEQSGEFANFSQWKEVAEFIELMSNKNGFDKDELHALFRKVRYMESVIQLIKPAPPGKPKNWQAYRARFVEPVRLKAGMQFWSDHAHALERAEEAYGVPAEIIVGIIGVETVYGRNTGGFRVLDALTTLAFDYPVTPTRAARMEFFKGELEHTLLFAKESGIDPFSLLGSYAGAIGWPQFMPGSIRKFAVDFNGDGKIDLRKSPVDAIGSVANFLVQHGWKRGEPIAFPVTVTTSRNENGGDSRWEAFIGQGLEAKFKLDELKATGIVPGIDPPADLPYGLVDLQNGLEATEYWLGAANFFAITQYNRSFFYAMSVIDLGRAVRAARSR